MRKKAGSVCSRMPLTMLEALSPDTSDRAASVAASDGEMTTERRGFLDGMCCTLRVGAALYAKVLHKASA
jgi:hypothetical protein